MLDGKGEGTPATGASQPQEQHQWKFNQEQVCTPSQKNTIPLFDKLSECWVPCRHVGLSSPGARRWLAPRMERRTFVLIGPLGDTFGESSPAQIQNGK